MITGSMLGKVSQASDHRFDAGEGLTSQRSQVRCWGRSYKPVITGSMLGKVSLASDHRFDDGEGLTSQGLQVR